METAYIGMGANLPGRAGEPPATLAAAARELERLGAVTARSSLYSTKPVGMADQPRFVNAAVGLETALTPLRLLEELLRVERAFGRDRSSGVLNGPRTLDLDLLLYGDWVMEAADLTLPHPRLGDRLFVLIPLNEIASNVVDAARGMSMAALLRDLQTRFPSEKDAIVRLESDAWRAGVLARGGARAIAPDAHG